MKLEDLKGKTVGVCVSGGLDSKTICCVLLDAGVKVKAFSANVGQADEKDINDIKKRMAPTGVDTEIVDVTKEMAEICFETVKCQAMYDGGYWNSTGIARAVTVQKLLPAMKRQAARFSSTVPPAAATTRCVLSAIRMFSILISESTPLGATAISSRSSPAAPRW